MMEIFYFLFVKLFTGFCLFVVFALVPAIWAIVLASNWSTVRVRGEKEDQFVGWHDLSVLAKRLIVVWTAFMFIIFGTQMNWLFNKPPSEIFDKLCHNFLEGYDAHKIEVLANQPPTRTDIGTEVKRFELVSYAPPKHFYVTIEDVKTHQVFKHIYVSKHCNSASSNKIGDEYNIRVTSYQMSNEPGVVYFQFHDLYNVFCS